MNQALLMLSPLLLVRLLEVSEYGRYRQFTVTAVFITSLASFSIGTNLNYLIARWPERAAINVTNACLLMFSTALLGSLAIVVGRGLIVPAEIAGYWELLAAYVLLVLNLDVLVSYWLANGRSDRVMFYTLGVTALRLGAVIGAAAVFRDVGMIIVAMVIAEGIKGLAVYVWLRSRGLLVFRWDGRALREQLRLVMPLGYGSFLYGLNANVGKLLVGTRLGAVPLAIYTTAAYQVPLVTIVKGALADVVFPDMVRRSERDPLHGLRLWKRMNVLFFSMVCPAWMLLTYFAEPVIRVLFTDAYVSATPYFQVFLLLMVRQCFNFSTPLRSLADNDSFARANAISLAINLAVTITLMPAYGLWGPTLGLVVGQLWVPFYLGRRVMLRYGVVLAQLCEWRKLSRSLLAALLALAALHVQQAAWPPSLTSAMGGVAIFSLVYLLGARILLTEEYEYVVRELGQKLWRRAGPSGARR